MAAGQPTLAPRFAGHETFPLRYGWLKKAVDGIADDPELFTRDDALVSLGVGKNMVRSSRPWALANRVLEEDADAPNNRGRKLRLTRLGKFVFGRGGIDPTWKNPPRFVSCTGSYARAATARPLGIGPLITSTSWSSPKSA